MSYGKPHRVVIYEDASGGWRWRLQSGQNRKILADSAEAYDSEYNIRRAINKLPFDFLKVRLILESHEITKRN